MRLHLSRGDRRTIGRYHQAMAADDDLQSWVQQAAAGDVLAAQRLIVFYHQRFYEVAQRRLTGTLQSKVAPEDLLQEVYAEALQKLGHFKNRDPNAFFNYLAAILESRLVDAHRRFHASVRDVRREVPPIEPATSLDPLAARVCKDSVTPSRIMARKEANAILLAAIAGLSPEHRKVLELRYIRNMTLADTAREMDRSVAAVQMLSLRALRQLRATLGSLSRIGY